MAFICFSNFEAANKAVDKMNNRLVCSKPIEVVIAQRKEDRITQLTTDYRRRNKNSPICNPPLYSLIREHLECLLYELENSSGNLNLNQIQSLLQKECFVIVLIIFAFLVKVNKQDV